MTNSANSAISHGRGLVSRIGPLMSNPLTAAGVAIVLIMAIVAIFAPVIAPYDPLVIDIRGRLLPPSAAHWFGTDEVGRDVFSRVIYGSRLSLGVSFTVVLIAGVIGAMIGCFAGFEGGLIESVIMRIVDIMLSIPGLVMAMALSAALGPSLENALIALVVVLVPSYIRLARGQARSVKGNAYVDAARLSGLSRWHILRKHVAPNSVQPVIIQSSVDLGNVILVAAALSFLGLGAQPPEPEWGALVGTGRNYFLDHWWCVVFAGGAIVLTAIGFNLLGDGLRDFLDPRHSEGR